MPAQNLTLTIGQLATAPYGRTTFTGTIAQVDPTDEWGDTWIRLVDGWRTHWVLSTALIRLHSKAA
jgi:hypothetical protein